LHWFDLEKFYKEVNRVARERSLLAVWGYELCKVDHDVDELFLDYYHNIVGPYWDEARKLVEDNYRSLPFPFEKIETPEFFIEVDWSLENFLGYLKPRKPTLKRRALIRWKIYHRVYKSSGL